jgi:hypothetical protein
VQSERLQRLPKNREFIKENKKRKQKKRKEKKRL